jgi:hypothetical protein
MLAFLLMSCKVGIKMRFCRKENQLKTLGKPMDALHSKRMFIDSSRILIIFLTHPQTP